MHRTARLLAAALACIAVGGALSLVVDPAAGALVLLGLLLLVAAIASSYLSDFLAGYRSAGENEG